MKIRSLVERLKHLGREWVALDTGAVSKEIQQAKKIHMNAPGRGDYRREESLTHTLCRDMAQGSILRRVSSVAMQVMNPKASCHTSNRPSEQKL